MKALKPYERHEADVAEILGCKLSCSSGRKWYSKGDGKSGITEVMPIMFDAKSTIKDAYRLSFDVWFKLAREASFDGCEAVLPIRFLGKKNESLLDIVVIPASMWYDMTGVEFVCTMEFKKPRVTYNIKMGDKFPYPITVSRDSHQFRVVVLELDEFAKMRRTYASSKTR